MSASPGFPGGIGLSHLEVYTSRAPDGLAGGSAHVHLACKEAYFVIAGHGAVQTLGPRGFHEEPLEPSTLVWFTPGIIHRLVNSDGKLEILVIMENAGMPEAGDFVFAFKTGILEDEAAYARAAALAIPGKAYAASWKAAQRRRDLAVEGFIELHQQFDREGIVALERFYQQATRLIRPKVGSWQEVLAAGPLAEVQRTQRQLEALAGGLYQHLKTADVQTLPAVNDARKPGMCGTLGVYLPEGTTASRSESL